MKKKILVPALVATVIGSGIAGSMVNSSAFATDKMGGSETEVSDKPEQKQLEKETKLTKQESIDIALEEVSGNVSDVELEKEDGIIIYSVKVTDDDGRRQEIVVDANSGKVLNVEADDEESGKEDGEENDKEEQKQLEKAATLTQDEGIAIALQKVSGKVKDIALEDENGVIVYAVDIVDDKEQEKEVMVDAKSGQVLKVEAEESDDENDDDNE